MLNKTIRSTIIVTIQFIVPTMLILTITPQLLNHIPKLNHARAFFNTHHLHFLIAHFSFYLTLFWSWPLLIKRISNNSDITLITTAISARWYLISTMAFLELLTYWK